MSERIGYRVDFPSESFVKVAREAERLGIDLGDLLAIAAAILVGVLVEAKRDVRKAAVKGAKRT
jgi:hypothetical protein